MMNGKKLFNHTMHEIQNMKPNESKATLSNLIMEQEIKRIKRVDAVKKCNVKRYASLKVQKELETEIKELLKEIETLKKENTELKQCKNGDAGGQPPLNPRDPYAMGAMAFKESNQIKEINGDDEEQYIIPEFEIMDTKEANKYIDSISDLLEELTETEDETINMNKYLSILRKNNLRKPSTYPRKERQIKQYKMIIEAIKNEFEPDEDEDED